MIHLVAIFHSGYRRLVRNRWHIEPFLWHLGCRHLDTVPCRVCQRLVLGSVKAFSAAYEGTRRLPGKNLYHSLDAPCGAPTAAQGGAVFLLSRYPRK